MGDPIGAVIDHTRTVITRSCFELSTATNNNVGLKATKASDRPNALEVMSGYGRSFYAWVVRIFPALC